MYKLLIVDDHDIVRAGLIQLFAESPGIEVVAEAGNGNEAIKLAQDIRFDVVLLDMSMPGKGGLEILKQLKKDQPELAVLILSMHPEDQYAVRALKAGASGYLTKRCAPDVLVDAVRKVAAGRKYISEGMAERLAMSVDNTARIVPHENLTDREYQIFIMLASGKQVSAIARELVLSTKTISAHRSNILGKMGMKSNSELMFYAINNGLIHQEKCIEHDATRNS